MKLKVDCKFFPFAVKTIILFWVPTLQKVKAIDTTGAGDAFNGSFSLALSQGKKIKECLDLANKVAGLSTTKLGAGDSMPILSDIS